MAPVSLALFWHHHQPYYPDDVAGENPMPWVRLHATKDYLGMALHLEEVPEFSCTINLVPSLLAQIQAYVHGASDTHLSSSRRPADGLEEDDACYILDNFFMANPDTMIRPHPRYHELFLMRSSWDSSAKQALYRFRPRDLRDLQVWSNLAWVHPLLFEKDPELAEFKNKGRYYTEEEKQWFLDKQRELVARVIPLHRELAARGQIELTTTPYYHPILPLLLDKTLAREAMPEVSLPAYRGGYPEDARRARAPRHREPYPPLRRTTTGHVAQRGLGLPGHDPAPGRARDRVDRDRRRDPGLLDRRQGRPRQPGPRPPSRAALPAPGRCKRPGTSWRSFFATIRCPTRSGFTISAVPARSRPPTSWGRWRPSATPAATIRRLSCRSFSTAKTAGSITRTAACRSSARSTRARPATRKIRPVKIGEFLRQHPPVDTLHHLFAGSWISHNFAIWIGHPEDNQGWDALHAARTFLVEEERSGRHDPAALAKAWDELYIAQGSDWFWWYGDDHSSALDGLFDHLFRKHVRNIYTLLGSDPPGWLFTPISRAGGQRPLHDQPISFSNVKVDGRATYFEWIDAARYVCGNDRGTMTLVAKGLLQCVWFGFDAERLLIRVDTEGGPARERLAEADRLRIGFVDPAEREIVVMEPARPRPIAYLNHAGRPVGQRDDGPGRDRRHPRAGCPLRAARPQSG